MKENKLPDGLSVHSTKASMQEYKFPQDYTVEELLDRYSDSPFYDEIYKKSLIEDHLIRKKGVGGVLATEARNLCDQLPEEYHEVIKASFGSVAASLEGSMPSTRWVVMDYQCNGLIDVNGKPGLDEHIRPHDNILQQYWNDVNG